jgi:hypothetical protein
MEFRAAKPITGRNAAKNHDSVPQRTVMYLSDVLYKADIEHVVRMGEMPVGLTLSSTVGVSSKEHPWFPITRRGS